MKLRKFFGIAAITISFVMVQPLYAQTETPVGKGSDAERAASAVGGGVALIGAWVIDVQNVATPPFQAMQTFHIGGSMNESTDLLANLGEGPGHGGWRKDGADTYTATFELFIFNPDHTPAGIIRVRETLKLTGENSLTGFAVADIILPDGTLIEDIDHGTLTGRRVRVAAVRPEELNGYPANAGFARRTPGQTH